MAGLDGIQNRIDPGEPLDKDIYDLPPEELANVPSLPGSLDESLTALENDHEFLLKGDVFHDLDDRTVDIVQTRKRDHSAPSAAASARVFDVLRRLIVLIGREWRTGKVLHSR